MHITGATLTLIDQLATVVVGQDPLTADALWQSLYQLRKSACTV